MLNVLISKETWRKDNLIPSTQSKTDNSLKHALQPHFYIKHTEQLKKTK